MSYGKRWSSWKTDVPIFDVQLCRLHFALMRRIILTITNLHIGHLHICTSKKRPIAETLFSLLIFNP